MSKTLDQPLRTRHEASLHYAVKRLRAIEARAVDVTARGFEDLDWIAEQARLALRCIADLTGERAADPHGEPCRNADWPAIAAIVNKDHSE